MKWLIETLKLNINTFAPIKADMLDIGTSTQPKKSVAIRMIPSKPGTQYFEGETIAKQFQLLVKSDNQLQVIDETERIARHLHNLQQKKHNVYDNTHKIVSLTIYTEPSFVEKTVANEWTYTALFKTELERVE